MSNETKFLIISFFMNCFISVILILGLIALRDMRSELEAIKKFEIYQFNEAKYCEER